MRGGEEDDRKRVGEAKVTGEERGGEDDRGRGGEDDREREGGEGCQCVPSVSALSMSLTWAST